MVATAPCGWIQAQSAAPPPPTPPCAGAPYPAYAPPEQPPATFVWHAAEALGAWQPPACLGWDWREGGLVVALAGSLRIAGGKDGLLGRLGAVSGWQTIRYWSASRGAWRDWLEDASALASEDPEDRRADFTAAELAAGGSFDLLQDEAGLVGPSIEALELSPLGADRLVLTMTNTAPILYGFITMVAPGEAELWLQLARAEGDLWRVYGLSRSVELPAILPIDPAKSALNRAYALLRHLAGQPTDGGPPLAP